MIFAMLGYNGSDSSNSFDGCNSADNSIWSEMMSTPVH
jgi:hypothetical protein